MSEGRVERRLTAILAADVAGYSRLIGENEESTLAALRTMRRETIDPTIARHRGRIVKTTGDGLLAEFQSVIDALRCAAVWQAAVPTDSPITWRIGIHQGDIVVEDDDIFGDGVNVAARLEALAEPGGICVSARVQEDSAGRLDLAFRDLGPQQLKNIGRPVHAYAIQISPVRPTGPVPSALPALSIVVLPFANLSNDPEQEYFADGITDDVTTDLSRIADSFVISRSTAFTYKGSPVNARQIGRDLGVRYVLEGSVRRIGERVRINAQLIDAESGAHLWAERIDTDCTDIAAAQDEITGRIARTLNLELVEAVGRRSERDQTVDPEARDLVWQGWAWYYRPRSREESLEQAQRAFERAFDIDPESVEAHIGIGTAISCALVEGFRRISADEQVRAERLLTKALERDAGRSMAHYGMGLLRRTQGRLIEAKIEFETAVSIDRNDAWSIGQLGQIFLHLGEPEAAIPYIERAMRLNPRDAITHEQYTRLGGCYVMLGRADQAIDLLRRAQALPYRNWAAHYVYGAACGLMGDLEEAKSAVLELVKVRPEATSLSKLRELNPWWSPRYLARAETTLFAGLRLAGFPDE